MTRLSAKQVHRALELTRRQSPNTRRTRTAFALALAVCAIGGVAAAYFSVGTQTDSHSVENVLHTGVTGGSISNPSGDLQMSKMSYKLNGVFVAGTVASAISLGMCGDALGQDAVQWRVEDGGNGHWYRGVVLASKGIPWASARAAAQAINADLAVLHTQAASDWVFANVVSNQSLWAGWLGPWIGGYQISGSDEPGGGWMWVDGASVTISWNGAQPDNALQCGGDNAWINYYSPGGIPANALSDMNYSGSTSCAPGYTGSAVFEYSSDCNGDGIVDYGQILTGQFADSNANGVPDICEVDPCPADIIQDNAVDGVDLSALLGSWGTDGGDYPRADIDRDGIVAGTDLAALLGAWGACP